MKVKIKHAGKVYEDLELNTDAPPTAFKQLVYEKTGVPLERMKVMVKGGMLKVCSHSTMEFVDDAFVKPQ